MSVDFKASHGHQHCTKLPRDKGVLGYP